VCIINLFGLLLLCLWNVTVLSLLYFAYLV
jgi:hypothetical protein